MASERLFSVALFDAFFSRQRNEWLPSKRVIQRRVSWATLCRSLTTFKVVDHGQKRRLPSWSPVRYRTDADGRPLERKTEHVAEVDVVVLDFDGGASIADGRRPWGDVAHVVHTTWSHTKETPRWRLVIPLASPVPVDRWERVWSWAHRCSELTADPKCKDPSRLYFVPAVRAGDWPREAIVHPGPRLVVPDELPPTAEELAAEARRAAMSPEAAAAVGHSRRRWLQDRLKTEPEARRRAAELLGARWTREGTVAAAARCPACGHFSVWWPIDPRGAGKALCHHRNSCDWSGWLDTLLEAAGVDLEATAS